MSMRQRSKVSSRLRFACGAVAMALLGVHAASAATGGGGAPVPFTRVEAYAENSVGGVNIRGSSYNTLAGEASEGHAVTLDKAGEYIDFFVPKESNAIVIRYSVPEKGPNIPFHVRREFAAPVRVYYGKDSSWVSLTTLQLTNKYSHYYGSYPFSTWPPDGNPHHFYDEVAYRAPVTFLAGGTKIRLAVLPLPGSPFVLPVTIDFVEFEKAPLPLTQPVGSISVTQAPYNASPSCQSDAWDAIQRAFKDGVAQGKLVWIPPGRYCLDKNPLGVHHVDGDNLKVRGAGMWHTILTGKKAGITGGAAPASRPTMSLFGFEDRWMTITRFGARIDDDPAKPIARKNMASTAFSPTRRSSISGSSTRKLA